MSDIILAAKGVRKVYRNGPREVRAVDGIDLSIRKEKSTAIVGPSGAGKSTLLHIMGGLDRPTSGRVELDGVNIYKISDRERAGMRNVRIGFVFQFYHLLPEFTALENVMLPALIRDTGYGVRDTKEKAAEVLKAVGLRDRVSHRPGELSGGESQRVAIARALVNEPQLLLCDEPTGNLDSRTSESIYELLFGLQSRHGMALVIVTHDENISSKVSATIRLRDGKVV